jgi:oxygen-independent coproporphyrinogen-3 oxidase
VHLPWCLKKCPYCDFNSHEWTHPIGLPEVQYVDALVADLESTLGLVWGRTVQSIFLGGGTPSLFSAASIDRLLGEIRARLKLLPDCEITLEANPGTFETHKFRAFRQAGITRLSVGVQSFHDPHLKALGRVHDRAQAVAALSEAAECFGTFNLDLMYALPGQTLDQCRADLQQALAFEPPHISIYHLSVEPNTYFAKYPPQLPDDDSAADMLDLITQETAAKGLHRYEVSAFSRIGHHARHNLNYWQFGDYLGIGAGAHSKLSFAHRVVRQVRLREPRTYMSAAMSGQALSQDDEVALTDLPFEFMLNALRLTQGFAIQEFTERTGLTLNAVQATLEHAQACGWLMRDLNRVWPTPLGLDFLSDLQALFLPD